MIFKKFFLLSVFCMLFIDLSGQIKQGRILYERKTNLYKSLKHWEGIKEWVKESEKNKVDQFELFFNDTIAIFKPIESEYKERFEWATNKNTTLQNLSSKFKATHKSIWGETFLLEDSVIARSWKLTDSKRVICGYECRKAIWQENDSSRIYAWYSDEIIPSFGPESFNGLPGTILGLATEDGGIIYFAKKIETITPLQKDFKLPKTRKKPMKTNEFKEMLQKEYGKEKWGKAMLLNNFGGVN
jgi:GLPGLI family protein